MSIFKKNKLFFHIIGSLLFLSLPIIFSPDFLKKSELIYINPFRRDFIGYFFLLGFFYINYYLLVPKYFFQKHYFLYFTIILIIYILITLLPQLIFGIPEFHFNPEFTNGVTEHFNIPPPLKPNENSIFIKTGPHFIQFIIVLIFSLMLKFNELLKRTEKEKTIAELSYLKAQINPHFLFNSLNSIYSLALDKSELAATAVVKLSGIMRYIINEASNDFVPLEKEINYIQDYIDLQKFRLEDTVNLTFNINNDSTDNTIAPLLLIPIVENTFKYGVSPEEESVIEISIEVKNNLLYLKTYNKKLQVILSEDNHNKLGLKNTKKRLESIYPGKFSLIITENELTYISELKIEL